MTFSDPYGLCAKDKDGREDFNCRAIINHLCVVAAQARVPRNTQNRFNQAADLYESTSRRVEMVSPRDRRLRTTDGSYAAGRTMDNVYLISNSLGAGDRAAVAAHEAIIHEHESGVYVGDFRSSLTDRQIWFQLAPRYQASAPFWRTKVGVREEPLIDW